MFYSREGQASRDQHGQRLSEKKKEMIQLLEKNPKEDFCVSGIPSSLSSQGSPGLTSSCSRKEVQVSRLDFSRIIAAATCGATTPCQYLF